MARARRKFLSAKENLLGRKQNESLPLIFGRKLNESKVRQIRNLYATGLYSQAQLARQVGVSPSTIGAIIHRKTWKHVK